MNFNSFNAQVVMFMIVAGAVSYATFYFIGSWSILVGMIAGVAYSLIFSRINKRKRP